MIAKTVELLLNIGFYKFTERVTEPVDLEHEPGFAPRPLAVKTFAQAD